MARQVVPDQHDRPAQLVVCRGQQPVRRLQRRGHAGHEVLSGSPVPHIQLDGGTYVLVAAPKTEIRELRFRHVEAMAQMTLVELERKAHCFAAQVEPAHDPGAL